MCSIQAAKMEGSHHVNGNSIIYREGAIHRTEIERSFLAAKGFNSNLVQFLLSYHVVICKVQVCSFMCTDVHIKWFRMYKILCTKNYNL